MKPPRLAAPLGRAAMRPLLASVLVVLVRCSCGVLLAWLRDAASFVGEVEAVAPGSDSVPALYRSAGLLSSVFPQEPFSWVLDSNARCVGG